MGEGSSRRSFSGSKDFIDGMVDHLRDGGIDGGRVHVDRRRPDRENYQIKLNGAAAVRLGSFLYDGVPPGMRLERKFSEYERFAGEPAKSPQEVDLEPLEALRTQPFNAHGSQLALFVKDTP